MLWRIIEVKQTVTKYLVVAEDTETAWNKYYDDKDLEIEFEDCDFIDIDIESVDNE